MEFFTLKNKNMEKLRRDSMGLGIIIGILFPGILFGILLTLSTFFAPEGKDYLIKLPTLILVSVLPNLFTLRYYLIKLKYDRTGRGILLTTFVFAILYFFIYLNII
jgi:cytochrome bd-type quinol oxidase subunit 2